MLTVMMAAQRTDVVERHDRVGICFVSDSHTDFLEVLTLANFAEREDHKIMH
jgi:hypothetical protein